MLTKEVIAHFGTKAAVARALDIKPPSVSGWGDKVPRLRQLQIEALTNGALKADAEIGVPVRSQPMPYAGPERRRRVA